MTVFFLIAAPAVIAAGLSWVFVRRYIRWKYRGALDIAVSLGLFVGFFMGAKYFLAGVAS